MYILYICSDRFLHQQCQGTSPWTLDCYNLQVRLFQGNDRHRPELQDREASGELCQTAGEAEESAFQQVEHPSDDCLVLVHCQ